MDFFSKYDQIGSFQQIWAHLLKKAVMEKFIFRAVSAEYFSRFSVRPLAFFSLFLVTIVIFF